MNRAHRRRAAAEPSRDNPRTSGVLTAECPADRPETTFNVRKAQAFACRSPWLSRPAPAWIVHTRGNQSRRFAFNLPFAAVFSEARSTKSMVSLGFFCCFLCRVLARAP